MGIVDCMNGAHIRVIEGGRGSRLGQDSVTSHIVRPEHFQSDSAVEHQVASGRPRQMLRSQGVIPLDTGQSPGWGRDGRGYPKSAGQHFARPHISRRSVIHPAREESHRCCDHVQIMDHLVLQNAVGVDDEQSAKPRWPRSTSTPYALQTSPSGSLANGNARDPMPLCDGEEVNQRTCVSIVSVLTANTSQCRSRNSSNRSLRAVNSVGQTSEKSPGRTSTRRRRSR